MTAEAEATESTPLLSTPLAAEGAPASATTTGVLSPFNRVCAIVFFLAVAFTVTATPLIYAFRTITCEILYDEGRLPPYEGKGDRCSRKEVEAETAVAISLMVTLTTISGVLNLLTTGMLNKKFGPKLAMISQVFWPCLRNLCQIFASTSPLSNGGRMAIHICQWTQLITILGGGGGYFLVSNTFVAALSTPEQRTARFGILQGISMLGTATGYVVGGLIGDLLGPVAPFQVTFCLLVLSTLLSTFCLPYIAPTPDEPKAGAEGKKSAAGGILGFLSPLKVFLPRVVAVEEGGNGKTYWGLTLLGSSVFTGVLAVSFVPFLLQLYATNTFAFHPTENGILLSANSLSRALFLTLLFPRIIAWGRKLYTTSTTPTPPSEIHIPTAPADIDPSTQPDAEEPALPPPMTDVGHGAQFDLVFVRWSMVLDGILTACTMLSSQGWHMYLAAGVLPLASGTAPASKGVIMEMVPAAQQPDALGGVALIEMLASVSTVSLFGLVFSYLSELGLAKYTFALNAALAFLAAFIAVWVRFPKVNKAVGGASV
ncbi:hypothetical protein MNV49_001811 [Pseudohyphozyma bogoriensis]|nr:hypothetical protein MNV49_001811 [Pseudohyphozyma bogoriensis]